MGWGRVETGTRTVLLLWFAAPSCPTMAMCSSLKPLLAGLQGGLTYLQKARKCSGITIAERFQARLALSLLLGWPVVLWCILVPNFSAAFTRFNPPHSPAVLCTGAGEAGQEDEGEERIGRVFAELYGSCASADLLQGMYQHLALGLNDCRTWLALPQESDSSAIMDSTSWSEYQVGAGGRACAAV